MPQAGSQQPAQPQQQRKALALSCVSASVAETATYPIDAIKTQLQLQRRTASSSVKPAGAVQLARQIFHRNGLSGLYAGRGAVSAHATMVQSRQLLPCTELQEHVYCRSM